ncbi:sugar phosphate isomerase/epimerase [Anseongella ginsenosidimutans]|uniref:Sugar phosphate isomerase/epimerase n=1 Tax=Anseongella ginsenosidimutans TaxID=496056 RepID=A0A4R3KP43_9SPHI|nr:sugar phosphate isomerase/epimerase family protein [Anseongella ginsenosidimutans]QEC52056.1 sugar phosphate isomerase/epimerase [Anseongella ginsenosidimutans]TCS85633.1 sugar phosphate isomerase/epimerase [Anseongella ginsenosidimutans]
MERRKFISVGALAGLAAGTISTGAFGAAAGSKETVAKEKRYQKGVSPWPICLDTATIRPASLKDKVKIAAKAGYDAIEPWDGELEKFEAEGGNLKDLGKEIRDLGLFVPSMIGLWNALPPTKELWEESLKDTRRRMRMAADIGAQHVQTIPNTVGDNYDVRWVAARYREIIEMGMNEFNLNPALVFVKYFPMRTMGQAAAVALDANHPKAMVIPDVFHMYISEGGFEGLKLLQGNAIAIFQFNDAPAAPSLPELGDEHRVFPGDGILPLTDILKDLKATGFKGCVSLELYNPEYWKQDLQQVAETGLRKTLEVIKKSGV